MISRVMWVMVALVLGTLQAVWGFATFTALFGMDFSPVYGPYLGVIGWVVRPLLMPIARNLEESIVVWLMLLIVFGVAYGKCGRHEGEIHA